MKKTFIKSTLILLIGGIVTKILGMLIKIVMGRFVGAEGLGLYMMILPSFSLFISLGQVGMPTALIKLVSTKKYNNKRLLFSIFTFTLIINLFLILIIIFGSKFIAVNLLKNINTYYGLLSIGLVIPFTTISSICRSYFFGKEMVFPHIISNIIEDVVRLILIFLGRSFYTKSLSFIVSYLILINVFSEIVSILVLLFFLPKKISLTKGDFIFDKNYFHDSLSIGIPNTLSRLISSIGYFLEPIILINMLNLNGYSNTYITYNYGVLSGFVMPIVLLPSFFTNALSQALFPIISRDYSNKNYSGIKKKMITGISLSFGIGFILSLFIFIFARYLLFFLYGTYEGLSFIRFLLVICLLQYIQSPLNICLDATNRSKYVLFGSIIGVVCRTLGLIVFSFFKIGIWSLILSISLNVVVTTVYLLKNVISSQRLHN